MVAEADTGGRKPTGIGKTLYLRHRAGLGAVPALVRLAAALHVQFRRGQRRPGARHPSVFRVPARLRHLSGVQIARRADGSRSTTGSSPSSAWCVAIYLLVFYKEIALRPGLPTTPDVVVSVIGVVLLVEAARRAVGPALAAIASIMLIYIFAGPWLPGHARAQGRVALARRLADVAHLGGHLRRRARRLDQRGVPVRAVRQPAGEGRRRKLFHPARLRHARHLSAAARPRPASSPPA